MPGTRGSVVGLMLLLLFFGGLAGPMVSSSLYGPERGALVIAGGGSLPREILETFIHLAGGPEALIVVVPTAGGRPDYDEGSAGLEAFRRAGAHNLRWLHTYDRKVADSDSLVGLLEGAGGVWFSGGRQWRLTDAYLGTRTEQAFHQVWQRGGVIGGTSAGASVQASYMVRGAPEGNQIMMAPGYEKGFGFLRQTAVDQHVDARGRAPDLLEVLAVWPELLGIGLWEGTAIIVQGDTVQVLGRGEVAFYDAFAPRSGEAPYNWKLRAGERFDLLRRRPLRP